MNQQRQTVNQSRQPGSVLVVCLILLMAGCQGDSTSGREGQAPKSNAELFSLHRPKTLAAAVDRLIEMHESIVSGQVDLPAPREIEYVEVIHGEGAAGHSHYFLASEFEQNDGKVVHDDHHEDMKETIERRTFEVDFYLELTDLANWLPYVGAELDLGESQWNTVNATSKTLKGIFKEIGSNADDATFRSTWQSKSDKIEKSLQAVRKVAQTTNKE